MNLIEYKNGYGTHTVLDIENIDFLQYDGEKSIIYLKSGSQIFEYGTKNFFDELILLIFAASENRQFEEVKKNLVINPIKLTKKQND